MQTPYLHIVDQPRMMKGGVRSTVFGVLGRTTDGAPNKSLGGLVVDTKLGHLSAGVSMKASAAPMNSDYCIIGPAAKTVLGHSGQVPYPGKFISKKGPSL